MVAVAIRLRGTLKDLAEQLHVHPSMAEAIREAAREAIGSSARLADAPGPHRVPLGAGRR